METIAAKATQVLYPAMRYQDAPKAIAWLKEAFAFEEVLVCPLPDGGIAHAELSYNGGIIMLGSSRADDYPVHSPGEMDGLTGGIYVYVADVDAHYARAKAAGARLVRGLMDTEYGSREYSAYDCEGHVWSFGTYRP